MKDNRYTTAFKKLLIKLDPICSKYGKSKLFFLIDAALAHIRYGVTPNQYIGFAFYKLSSLERSQFYTARHQDKYDVIFNKPSDSHFFNHKPDTLKAFAPFIKRDWLYTPDASEEEIERFIETHDKIIVKPLGLSSGRGIFVRKNEIASELKNNDYLLEEFVTQHHEIMACNPSSVNTIRAYVLIPKDLSTPPNLSALYCA